MAMAISMNASCKPSLHDKVCEPNDNSTVGLSYQTPNILYEEHLLQHNHRNLKPDTIHIDWSVFVEHGLTLVPKT